MRFKPAHRKAPIYNIEDAKKTLFEAKKILDDLGVKFFLVYGTALGAHRDKGLIEWDYDIDLGIIGEERRDEVREAFIKNGYQVKKRGKHHLKYIPAIKNDIKLDIHFYREEGDKLVVYSHFDMAWMWHPKQFLLLEDIKMYGVKWKVPSPIEEYLSWTYGDWKEPSELSATTRNL